MLNPRQKRFVDEYMLDHRGAAAAVRAGYARAGAKVTACRLLTNANVCEALAAREKEVQAEFQLTRNAVMAGLLQAVEDGKQLSNPMAQIAAWREIAKICGYYAPEVRKVQLDAQSTALRARLTALDDEELLRIAEGSVTAEQR